MKRILMLVVAAIMIMLLISCSNTQLTKDRSETITQETDMASEKSTEPPAEDSADISEKESEQLLDDDEFGSDTQDLSKLECPESFVNNNNNVFLKKNGKYYLMANYLPDDLCEKRGIGRYNNSAAAKLYLFCDNGFVSSGDVPCPSIQTGDEVVGYNITTVFLDKVSETGTTICITEDYGSGVGVGHIINIHDSVSGIPQRVLIDTDKGKDFQITDDTGSVVENYRNLTKDRNYLVSWFDKTQYNEVKMLADCTFYEAPHRLYREECDYTIEGELNKSGYSTFDFSQLPAGIYKIDYYGTVSPGFIEIE